MLHFCCGCTETKSLASSDGSILYTCHFVDLGDLFGSNCFDLFILLETIGVGMKMFPVHSGLVLVPVSSLSLMRYLQSSAAAQLGIEANEVDSTIHANIMPLVLQFSVLSEEISAVFGEEFLGALNY